MKNLILLIFIFLIPTNLFARDDWTKKDTAYQAVFILLQGMDWQQTKEITRDPDHYEMNRILGEHPRQNKIDLYFLSTTLLHTGIAYYLPKDYRRVWQCIWIGIEIHCVYHNHSAGIRIDF